MSSLPLAQQSLSIETSVAVLIPAAGRGTRMGTGENKVLLPVAGKPLILYTLSVFHAHPAVGRIGIIGRPEEQAAFDRAIGGRAAWPKLMAWLPGGAERQESVYNGLSALAAHPPDRVLVHDGARPALSTALIDRVLDALQGAQAAVPALPVQDTVRRVADGRSQVVSREGLYLTQTPQGFHFGVLWAAHQWARQTGLQGTDDAQLVEAYTERAGLREVWPEQGQPAEMKSTTEGSGPERPPAPMVRIVDGEVGNIKVTTVEDLQRVEGVLLRQVAHGSLGGPCG